MRSRELGGPALPDIGNFWMSRLSGSSAWMPDGPYIRASGFVLYFSFFVGKGGNASCTIAPERGCGGLQQGSPSWPMIRLILVLVSNVFVLVFHGCA